MSESGYYGRVPGENSDGTPVYANDLDKANEGEVRGALEAAWGCEVRPFGPLCPIDFYVLRDGRLAGVVEAKVRSHGSDRFETVFLNVVEV